MTAYTFHIVSPPGQTISRVKTLESDADAVAYGRQLLSDWPECELIEIASPEGMVDRLRQRRAS